MSTNNCGCNDPCQPTIPCSCKVRLPSDCITVSGSTLTCSGIADGQTLTETLNQVDEFICNKFNEVTGYFSLINIGTGSQVYKGINGIGNRELRTITKTGNLVTVTQNTNDIQISLDETVLKTFIQGNQKTYTVANSGTGAEIYANNTFVGDNTQLNLKSLKSSNNSVVITQSATEIDLIVPATALPDGSETKINAGTNVTISGTGTLANPYVINSTNPDGSETKINAGTNISITGLGTIGSPYIITNSLDGSETKITAGTNITVAGAGSVSNPYVISTFDYDATNVGITGAEVFKNKVSNMFNFRKLKSSNGSVIITQNENDIDFITSSSIGTPIKIGLIEDIDAGNTTGSLTTSGDIATATATAPGSGISVITAVFLTPMPNSNYYLRCFVDGGIDVTQDPGFGQIIFQVIDELSFKLVMQEFVSFPQNFRIIVEAVPFT